MMEHLVSWQEIVAAGDGFEVSHHQTPNKSPKRFNRWSIVADEAKAFDKRELSNQ